MGFVFATHVDSIRIEVLGESRAVTIPAGLILAANDVLKAITIGGDSLTIEPVESDDGEEGFDAYINADVAVSYGVTAWEALLNLAERLAENA